MRLVGDGGDRLIGGHPLLEVGDSVTLHGYTITVTADSGSTHMVSITRSN